MKKNCLFVLDFLLWFLVLAMPCDLLWGEEFFFLFFKAEESLFIIMIEWSMYGIPTNLSLNVRAIYCFRFFFSFCVPFRLSCCIVVSLHIHIFVVVAFESIWMHLTSFPKWKYFFTFFLLHSLIRKGKKSKKIFIFPK